MDEEVAMPTVTTDLAALTSYRYTYEEAGSADMNVYSFLEIALPDLTGYTVTDATCTIYISAESSPPSLNVTAHCDDQADWSNSSTRGTLEGFSFGSQVSSFSIDGDAVGVNGAVTFSILGSATEGIAKIYTADSSPDPCTIKLIASDYTGVAVTDSIATGFQLGEQGNDRIQFYTNNATYYPRITITYAGGGKPNYYYDQM